ncbi:MAG: zinc-binding alcohol dehydrogenase family protein [Pseudonocardia sp.]|uniref:zinc-binding alcohol dehydrogenase family protein n=1 Tax=Pseudonocardia sp. TaxID=60912 RepID=UPI001ACB283C|nr:zinc-binding alcohol dehydrogenase family protein [Pseudonocardia sp.]
MSADTDHRPLRGAPVERPLPVAVLRRTIRLHGREVTFLEAGAERGGPVVALLHGLASSSATWTRTVELLGAHAHVIAPDLLGHSRSAKSPSGDYSLGAYAAGLRDLLVTLGLDGATIVGHSFGGGVAMQFAYQFPELVRLTRLLLPLVPAVSVSELDGLMGAFTSFADHGARGAFAQTVRGTLNWSGQRLDGTERLYLLREIPVLLVGGARDAIIPVAHTARPAAGQPARGLRRRRARPAHRAAAAVRPGAGRLPRHHRARTRRSAVAATAAGRHAAGAGMTPGIPAGMNAWTVGEPGPIETGPLVYGRRPVPRPGPDELLLRVWACGVCRTDLHVSEGDLPVHRAHVTPGHEVVGDVVGLGTDVAAFAPGDLVGMAWLRRTCGTCVYCLRGAENLCPSSQYNGWDADGDYAEYVTVPAAFAYRLPAAFADPGMAVLLCAGIIGYRALVRAGLPTGGRLGLYGFGGSAHLCAQLTLAQGATVHVTDTPPLDYEHELFYEKEIRSVTANTRRDGVEFLDLAARYGLRPTRHRYPLAGAQQALQDLKAGRFDGAAVLVGTPEP